jgi:hypothetical protein
MALHASKIPVLDRRVRRSPQRPVTSTNLEPVAAILSIRRDVNADEYYLLFDTANALFAACALVAGLARRNGQSRSPNLLPKGAHVLNCRCTSHSGSTRSDNGSRHHGTRGEMLSHQPALQLVRAHNLADDYVVRAVIASFHCLTREGTCFLEHDLVRVDQALPM